MKHGEIHKRRKTFTRTCETMFCFLVRGVYKDHQVDWFPIRLIQCFHGGSSAPSPLNACLEEWAPQSPADTCLVSEILPLRYWQSPVCCVRCVGLSPFSFHLKIISISTVNNEAIPNTALDTPAWKENCVAFQEMQDFYCDVLKLDVDMVCFNCVGSEVGHCRQAADVP